MKKNLRPAHVCLALMTLLGSCSKNNDNNGGTGGSATAVLPAVTTTAVASIAATTAESGGNVTSDGGADVSARGICWNTSPTPTVSNNKTSDGTGKGSFISQVTSLAPNTTYYLRAYATNSAGTAYGTEINFKTLPVQAPTVITSPAANIKQVSAQSGGVISSDGGAAVSARGICWNTSANPTTANNKTSDASGGGSFTSTLTAIAPNTTYYVRAYATNSAGTSYGAQITITTLALSIAGAGVTDIDGNKYATVILADKEWMAQNLRTAHYRNGDSIANITTTDVTWANATTGAWSYYNNTAGYNSTYGKLYNHYAIADNRQVCPTGWHIPSLGEWAALSGYLGGDNASGASLKETGVGNWISPNTGATNASGFTALPGGMRYGSCACGFTEMGTFGYLHAADGSSSSGSYVRLSNSTTIIISSSSSLSAGFSARCVKD